LQDFTQTSPSNRRHRGKSTLFRQRSWAIVYPECIHIKYAVIAEQFDVPLQTYSVNVASSARNVVLLLVSRMNCCLHLNTVVTLGLIRWHSSIAYMLHFISLAPFDRAVKSKPVTKRFANKDWIRFCRNAMIYVHQFLHVMFLIQNISDKTTVNQNWPYNRILLSFCFLVISSMNKMSRKHFRNMFRLHVFIDIYAFKTRVGGWWYYLMGLNLR